MKSTFIKSSNWVLESIYLVKHSFKISLFFGMLYLVLYMILPAIPGMQFLGLFAVFIWPFVTICIIFFYQKLSQKEPFDLQEALKMIKPKVSGILMVGLLSFIYAGILSSLIGADITSLIELSKNTPDYNFMFDDFSGIIYKIIVIAIPFMMMTWFAPLLIAFKGYSFFRAIKSSFAACLLYLIPIALGLLIISLCFLFIVLAISFIFAFIGTSASGLFSFVLSFLLIIAMAAFMALTFAIQSVTFKAIFK
jgi:hypothetical protein